jgi:hypothetical protein
MPQISLLTTLLNSNLIHWIATQLMQIWRESRFQGTYKVDSHQSTLELCDTGGQTAKYTKRQTITFTQNNVFAIQDQAWGDGEIFADYQTSLGKPVDWYEEGHRWKVLISLRASRNQGEQESFWIERTIKNGFTKQANNFSVRIDHPTQNLSLSVIFPNSRLPRHISFLEQNAKRSHALKNEHITSLSQEQTQYTYPIPKPHLFEEYSLRWEW